MRFIVRFVFVLGLANPLIAEEKNPFSMFEGSFNVIESACYQEGSVATATLKCKSSDASCQLLFFRPNGKEWIGLGREFYNRDESDDGYAVSQTVKKIANGAQYESKTISPHGFSTARIQMTATNITSQVEYVESFSGGRFSSEKRCRFLLRLKK